MKLLAPTAGPIPARENADYIMEIAKKLEAEVIALHIFSDPNEKTLGEEALKIFVDAGKRRGIPVQTILKEGEVIPSITETAEAEKVSLIVMGATSGRIVADWIVTDVLQKTNIPVVIIPYGFADIEF